MQAPNILPLAAPLVLALSSSSVAQSAETEAHRPPRTSPSAPATSTAFAPVQGLVENRGQWDGGTLFLGRGAGLDVRVERDAIAFHRRLDERSGVVLRLVFEGVGPKCRPAGAERAPGLYHFYLGRDPSRWRTHVPAWREVVWRDLHPGIDFVLRCTPKGLEYEVRLAPGARPENLVLRTEGADDVRLLSDGTLALASQDGHLLHEPPATWADTPHGRHPVPSGFCLLDRHRFTLDVAAPCSQRRVIDPGILWSTFLGGDPDAGKFANLIEGVVVSEAGDALVAGWTGSPVFPTTPGAYQEAYSGGFFDAFVTRLDGASGDLVASTLLGGSQTDMAQGIALAPDGVVTIAGFTASPDFPVTPGAFSTQYAQLGDVFVTALSGDLSTLQHSTFVGGSFTDTPVRTDVSPSGEPLVCGITNSLDFPVTPRALQQSYSGGTGDAFVVKLTANLGALVFATYLGGSEIDSALGLAVDPDGLIAVGGLTFSPDFPVTAGAFDSKYDDKRDVFVSVLDPSGTSLAYSTFLGGSNNDQPRHLALAPGHRATVVGETFSQDFPTTPHAFKARCPFFCPGDGFVARLDPSGSSLEFSSYFGGFGPDQVWAVDVDSAGQTVIAGDTVEPTAGFPTTKGALKVHSPPLSLKDAFVARLDPTGSELFYSTLLGGSNPDGSIGPEPVLVATGKDGAATVTGRSKSDDFPVTHGFDPVPHAAKSFIVRLDLLPTGVTRFGTSTPGCRGPLAISVTAMPEPGLENFALTCTGAPTRADGLLGLSTDGMEAPIDASGAELWLRPGPMVLVPAESDAFGFARTKLPLPPEVATPGSTFFAQFFWLDPCAPDGVSASCALRIEVQEP